MKKSDKFKKMKSRFIEDEADEGSESDDEITGKAPKESEYYTKEQLEPKSRRLT